MERTVEKRGKSVELWTAEELRQEEHASDETDIPDEGSVTLKKSFSSGRCERFTFVPLVSPSL